MTTGGANLNGILVGASSPAVHIADHDDGSYEIRYTIEKAGNYQFKLASGSHSLGEKNVTCVPSSFSGAHSVATGPGISEATIGMKKKEKATWEKRIGRNICGFIQSCSLLTFV